MDKYVINTKNMTLKEKRAAQKRVRQLKRRMRISKRRFRELMRLNFKEADFINCRPF